MILDLSDFKETGGKQEIESEIEIGNIEYRGSEIEIPELFSLKLIIYNTSDTFVFTGELKGELLLECSRCLEEFRYPVEINFNEEIAKADIEDLRKVDLTELFVENILLAIPIKPLCSQDCQGLCPECGQNLNKGQCECDTETVDPRMAKLKDLLDK